MLSRLALVALFTASPVFAAQDPLDLARGLRDISQPDLALEYLNDLAKRNPAADVKVILPLERAKCLLTMAQMESEEAAREGGVAQAKTSFEDFLKANPKHPRAAEAQLALAQVTAVQAVGALQRAGKINLGDKAKTKDKRDAAKKASRELFVKASALFGEASKNLGSQLSSAPDERRKSELERTMLQAELDRGINQYRLVDTYPDNVEGKDVIERGAELDKARKIFLDLGRKDDTSPVCWQAKAWAGMCEADKSDRAASDKIFNAVLKDGTKNPAAADGVRMVEFFRTRMMYLTALEEKSKKSVNDARIAVKSWLDKDRYRPRLTPQRLSMTFYFAYLTELLGQSEIIWEKPAKPNDDKPPKMKGVSAQGMSYLKEAAREYKRLLETDNEYTERATENRNRATRFIVGDNPKEPRFYTDLEECQMAGMIQLMKATESRAEAAEAGEDKAEAAKKKTEGEFAKAIALTTRARQLLDGASPPREVAETKFNQAIAYHSAGQYPLAAVSGDALARTGRGAIAAKGGYVGVDSYLRSREKQDENADEISKASDRDRAIALGMYLDKTFPADPSTDYARLRVGQLYAVEKQYQAAFDILGRINPAFSEIASARSVQGRVAFMLIAGKESTLNEAQKAAVFKKAVDDCEKVAEPAGGPGLLAYFSVRTLLANLHLADRPRGYAAAEKVAADNLKAIAASPLEDADKKMLFFGCDEVRLRAVYGQAFKLFEEGKYKDLGDKLAPVLVQMNEVGKALTDTVPAEAKPSAASLDSFRRDLVVLAMQGRLKEGEFDKAAGLFELLDKLGGGIDATSAALSRLTSMVRPQVEALRTANKAADADKLSNTIGTLLQKQASKEKLPLRVQASLGRSLRDLGQYDKSIEVLKKIPEPPKELMAKKTSEMEEADAEKVISFQIAQIELARAYRFSKNYPEADKVMLAALGTDKAKGWAKSLEFKKEAVLLLEDKAANAPAEPKDARSKAWRDAMKGWETLVGQYQAALANKELQPNDREKLAPIFLELVCDLRRCIIRGNSQLITDPAKLNESLVKLGGKVHEVETDNPPTALTEEVKAKFRALLKDYPVAKEEYKKRGGKAFLEE